MLYKAQTLDGKEVYLSEAALRNPWFAKRYSLSTEGLEWQLEFDITDAAAEDSLEPQQALDHFFAESIDLLEDLIPTPTTRKVKK
jgi:hypothetical protein